MQVTLPFVNMQSPALLVFDLASSVIT